MAAYPDDLHYTKDHEWMRVSGDSATVGITGFAQEQLGDVVHVQLPSVGATFAAHDPFGEVESVKTFSELFTPASGEVTAVNEALADAPELVNTSPYDDGWMVKLKLSKPSEIDALLSAAEYDDLVESQKE